MSAQRRRHPAGRATYRGDVRRSIVGEIKGPTTYGMFVIAERATHVAAVDRTFVEFGAVSVDEFRELVAAGASL